ncbi:MAG TPA: hypothetical protein ENL13_03705, partial [Thermoplasmatales archaeon]|nr:hypothetical protein [Thermoplasmatales archaeon]
MYNTRCKSKWYRLITMAIVFVMLLIPLNTTIRTTQASQPLTKLDDSDAELVVGDIVSPPASGPTGS